MTDQISRRAEVLRQSAMPKPWYCDRIACLESDLIKEKMRSEKIAKVATDMLDYFVVGYMGRTIAEQDMAKLSFIERLRALGVEVDG